MLIVVFRLCSGQFSQAMHVNVTNIIYYFLIFILPDRVFGPTTTTRHVYDVAAQHVVSGAMEGINGSIF